MITELGLLDRDLAAHHAAFDVPTKDHQHGVAYPAVFVLGQDGTVVDKRIRESYRAREGALKLLEEALHLTLPTAGPQQSAAASHLTVSAAADSDQYVRWQETRLHVIFEVEPGWHLYGRPIPDGYIPLTVEIAAVPEVKVNPAEFPPTRSFRVAGLGEEFQVHEGRFEIRVPIAVNIPPGRGSIELEVMVRYQACSESECLPPQRLTLDVRLDEAPAA